MYPSKGSVFFKFVRTFLGAAFLCAVLVLAALLALKVSALPFLTMILTYVMPAIWVFLIVYLLMWVGVYFSYNDFQWASRLCEAKESYDLGRYRKALDYAGFALNYKKKCGLSYYLRSRAYENLDSESLHQSDLDMAISLGIIPDNLDF